SVPCRDPWWASLSTVQPARKSGAGSRSRVEGDKRTEKSRNSTRAMRVSEATGWGDHGSGLEVSGSVVSVSQGHPVTRRSVQSTVPPGNRRRVGNSKAEARKAVGLK